MKYKEERQRRQTWIKGGGKKKATDIYIKYKGQKSKLFGQTKKFVN